MRRSGAPPVPCTRRARLQIMKKIISAAALTAAALTLATPAAHAAPVSTQHNPAGSATRADGPLGPGLSELVAIAEGVLKKYGITR